MSGVELESSGGAGERTERAVRDARRESLFRRLAPKVGLSLVLGGVFVWIVDRQGVPVIPPGGAFAAVRWWTVPAYVVLLALTHWFRASRWRFLIAPVAHVPLREVVILNWIGFFAIFALPFRLGELARPALTKMRHGIAISAGVGTVAVERVVDGLLMALCLVWAMFALPRAATTDPLARALPALGWLAVLVFAGALVALSLFLWQRAFATRLTERVFGLVSPRLGATLADKVGSIADGMRTLTRGRLLGGFLAETFAYWALNACGMWLLGWGVGLPMGPGHALAVMGILAIGILLPAGPGLFGNFQLAVSTALHFYFAADLVGTAGAAYVFLLYVTQAVFITLAGVIPLYALRIPLGALLRPPRDTVVPPARG